MYVQLVFHLFTRSFGVLLWELLTGEMPYRVSGICVHFSDFQFCGGSLGQSPEISQITDLGGWSGVTGFEGGGGHDFRCSYCCVYLIK